MTPHIKFTKKGNKRKKLALYAIGNVEAYYDTQSFNANFEDNSSVIAAEKY